LATTLFVDAVTLSSASWFNDVDSGIYALTAVAGTNTITATGPNSLTAYATGKIAKFIPAATNSGATTLNISSLGAKNVYYNGVSCSGGELKINVPVQVYYDGTQFNILGSVPPSSIIRSMLAGLTLSTAGSSATMSIAAGQCADSTNVALMTLAATSKTTSAWAVGSATGGLDTGAIANSTWYHFFVIQRVDTGVVDALISLSPTAPTMPTNYTLFRRIGSGKTNGSAQWTLFKQDGDYFEWDTPILDVNVNTTGTSAVTRTLTVPTGVNVRAVMNANVTSTAGDGVYLSDLAVADLASSSSTAPGETIAVGGAGRTGAQAIVRTNTSAQIRSRMRAGGAADFLNIITFAWYDTRGRDA